MSSTLRRPRRLSFSSSAGPMPLSTVSDVCPALACIFSTLGRGRPDRAQRSEEHTSELQSRPHLVCRLLLEKKKKTICNYKLPSSTDTSSADLVQCVVA